MGGKVRFSIGFDLSTGISVSVVLTPIGYGERQRAAIPRSTKSRSGFVVQPVSAKAKSSLAQAGSHATLVSSAPRTTRAPRRSGVKRLLLGIRRRRISSSDLVQGTSGTFTLGRHRLGLRRELHLPGGR
jgi:hypothetical protein